MTSIHEPDPRFLENLEWQLTSAKRRRESFGGPRDDFKKRRTIKMIGIIACSVLTGVMATATTTHFEAVAQGKLLLAQAEIRLQLADTQIKYFADELADIRNKVKLGLIRVEEGDRAAGHLNRLGIQREKLVLDLEEIEASHQSPRNDLSAPLVGGRDYVTSRLELDVKSLQTDVVQVEAEAKRTGDLSKAGLVSPEEGDAPRLELNRLAAAMNELYRKIDLRARFLRGEISAEGVEFLALSAETEKKVKRAEMYLAQVQAEYTAAEHRHQLGLISTGDMERTRLALQTAAAELKLANLEMQFLSQQTHK